MGGVPEMRKALLTIITCYMSAAIVSCSSGTPGVSPVQPASKVSALSCNNSAYGEDLLRCCEDLNLCDDGALGVCFLCINIRGRDGGIPDCTTITFCDTGGGICLKSGCSNLSIDGGP